MQSTKAELRSLIELVGVCAYAITQPTLGLLGNNPAVFYDRASPLWIAIVIVAIVVFAVPLGAWMIEVAITRATPTNIRSQVRQWLHAGFLSMGVVVIFQGIAKQSSLNPVGLRVSLAILMGLGAMPLVKKWKPATAFLRWSAIAPIAMGILFITSSQVSPIFVGDVTAPRVGRPRAPKRVVMVVFDELPLVALLNGRGAIDADLYPQFARLSRSSSWYRNNTTVAPITTVAVPAMLTGRYPRRENALPINRDYPENLFTLLGPNYTMNVHEVATQLCPHTYCHASDPDLTGLVGDTARFWTNWASPAPIPKRSFLPELRSDQIRASVTDFVQSLKVANHPRLDFLHVLLPHQPFHYVGALQDYGLHTPMPGWHDFKWVDAAAADVARRRELLQLQTADWVLGTILDRLAEQRAFDDAMVVVTADHGMSFSVGEPLRNVTQGNYHQIMWTPLFVHRPGQTEAKISDDPTLSIDVLPTIAQQLGLTIPWAVDGQPTDAKPRPVGPLRMYQWAGTGFAPPDLITAKSPSLFLTFDGARGYANVVAASPTTQVGDARLRIYRIGPYADLVGRPAQSLLSKPQPDAATTIQEPRRLGRVDPAAATVPWVYIAGSVSHLGPGRFVALIDHGLIIAVAQTSPLSTKESSFQFLVPPALMIAGSHRVSVAVIDGSPTTPTLHMTTNGP